MPLSIIIKCEVLSFLFLTKPSDLIIKVGIDTQPAEIPFSVIKTPNCPQAATFAISETLPNFLSLQNESDFSGKVLVTGATIGDHDSYPLTLTASVDSKNATA